ncbi:MAG: hypothetical protein ABIB97_02915 [Patescibacteria group bacterium]
MAEIEKIGEESFIAFDKKNISKVPHVAGIIELANLEREVIYIDSSPDINKKLFELIDSYDPCLDNAKFYRIEINPGVDQGLLKAFQRYKEAHENHIPRCNRMDPTRRVK